MVNVTPCTVNDIVSRAAVERPTLAIATANRETRPVLSIFMADDRVTCLCSPWGPRYNNSDETSDNFDRIKRTGGARSSSIVFACCTRVAWLRTLHFTYCGDIRFKTLELGLIHVADVNYIQVVNYFRHLSRHAQMLRNTG